MTAPAPPPTPRFTVSVRELCAFAAKAGDLDLRFTPSPSAEEGRAGHRIVAARRGAGARAEVSVQAVHGTLQVRGRIDVFDEAGERIEEVKTHRGAVERIPANHRALHWAQAKVYGAMLCRERGLAALRVSLVYFDIDSQHETPLVERFEAPALEAFFQALCERFIAWSDGELAHRARRDAALQRLAWPHEGFRSGQRELATAVYNAARSGRSLLAQAPTGIGKTMATLFPMLKAMPGQQLDKLFFLTARTPGRLMALESLARLRSAMHPPGADEAAPLRVVALVARDKACEHPDKACHGDSCPLARGFYDRLPAARAEAAPLLALEPAELRGAALRHGVCPYYLAQEMTRWADVVVADYNYLLDSSALLHALTTENAWRVGLLVDEAHNLVPRGRAMYTAELDPQRLRAARAEAPQALRRPLDRLRRAWSAVAKAQAQDFQAHERVPPRLLEALRDLAASIGQAMAEDPAAVGGELLQLHFDALRFGTLAESLDRHSQFDVSRERRALRGGRERIEARLCVRNIVPAPFLRPRWAGAHAAVLFSATLEPVAYQLELLGLAESTAVVDVESPFSAGQLQIRVAGHLSTRYAHRHRSLPGVAALIVEQYRAQPGNYLAFFSSFDYLDQVASAVAGLAPELPLRSQRRGMSEAERAGFVASFEAGGAQIGFAVLGGAFGEGVDLPGTRLIGVFVATLGLPQVNPVNEAMKQRLHEIFGDGYAYAYLYPGLQKVVQAAGRVIRTPEDRGVVHLIDDRFRQPAVKALLPGWWGLR